jgi:hypothetical protein
MTIFRQVGEFRVLVCQVLPLTFVVSLSLEIFVRAVHCGPFRICSWIFYLLYTLILTFILFFCFTRDFNILLLKFLPSVDYRDAARYPFSSLT